MIVSVGMKTGISIRRDNPKGVGADRIVNLVAANEIYGGPAVVIDYGTANTFDVINEKSEFITGLITPGISVCADALCCQWFRVGLAHERVYRCARHRFLVHSERRGYAAGAVTMPVSGLWCSSITSQVLTAWQPTAYRLAIDCEGGVGKAVLHAGLSSLLFSLFPRKKTCFLSVIPQPIRTFAAL